MKERSKVRWLSRYQILNTIPARPNNLSFSKALSVSTIQNDSILDLTLYLQYSCLNDILFHPILGGVLISVLSVETNQAQRLITIIDSEYYSFVEFLGILEGLNIEETAT